MTQCKSCLTALAVLICVIAVQGEQASVTTGTLIGEMVDMMRLADYPSPSYRTIQFSSTDRRSVLTDDPEWFANCDGFGNEPKPNFAGTIKEPGENGIGEYLVCDIKGPGAIVRTWTAAIEGTLRIYLDGAEQPVYDGSASDFLKYPWNSWLGGTGIEPDMLKGPFYQRDAAYCPIPFEKGCRITWTGSIKKIHFYEVQTRIYDTGTKVVSFTPGDIKTYAETIRKTAGILKDPDGAWPYISKSEPRVFNLTVKADSRADAVSLDGPAAIERLVVKVEAVDMKKALRQTVMHISCDGARWGQVQCPVGDFFGAAPGINPYDSAPFTVRPDGTMVSRYVMPFSKNIKITFENMGAQDVKITGEVLPVEYKWSLESSMYFRAKWRIDHGLVGPMGPVQDLPFLMARGKGVYVGTVSFILNIGTGPHPGGSWWGEGDEKIFVDDETVASTFGTGSEDYYNYAWSAPDIFIYPYCGQPRNDGPANRGFITNNRYHILDALPFSSGISFYMEYFPHEPTRDNAYARISYHYGKPGMIDDHVVITREDVRDQHLSPRWTPSAVGGASHSIFLEPEDYLKDNGRGISLKFVEDNLWTNGRHLRWFPKGNGDELVLNVPVQEAGKYSFRIGCAYDKDSGRISLKTNGQSGKTENLNRPYRTMIRCPDAGVVELGKGDVAAVTVKYEDGPENGSVGLDFIWIQKR